jgi:hypothetical protein
VANGGSVTTTWRLTLPFGTSRPSSSGCGSALLWAALCLMLALAAGWFIPRSYLR